VLLLLVGVSHAAAIHPTTYAGADR
jgi:hypothetical protein